MSDVAKHTPAPWQFSDGKEAVSFTEVPCRDGVQRGRLAASIYHASKPNFPIIRVGAINESADEVLANARLIAAAPDLLEALKALSAAIFVSDDHGSPELVAAIEMTVAAIMKAEVRP